MPNPELCRVIFDNDLQSVSIALTHETQIFEEYTYKWYFCASFHKGGTNSRFSAYFPEHQNPRIRGSAQGEQNLSF